MARKSRPKKEEKRQVRRYFWSGTISFGLVTIPVNLYPAQRRTSLSLRMLDDDGTPLARRYYCPQDGQDVHPEHLLRGYEVDGEYVIVRDDELEAIAPRKSKDINLTRFVKTADVDPIFFDRAYYLVPAGPSTKAYHLLAEVMENSGRAGIATFVMRDHEYLVAILAENGVLRAEVMRFADEIRSPRDVGLPKKQKADRATVTWLKGQIRQLADDELSTREMQDTTSERLRQLVERKVRDQRDIVTAPDVADVQDSEEEDVDLLEVIRSSMRAAGVESADETNAGEDDLDSLTKGQLYERAKELDIPGRSHMTRQQLIKALRAELAHH